MISFNTIHPNRKIIELSGLDKADFLQGIITQDVGLLDNQNIIYALMLSPQGRFQFELFIIKISDDLWLLDVEAEFRDSILKRLGMFKLRSKVELKSSDEWFVKICSEPDGNFCVNDPRAEALGYRAYVKNAPTFLQSDFDEYNKLRISLAIADGAQDMIVDKSIPLEWRMDELNAISWTKGCYVGQELTARTKHLGIVRKRPYPVQLLANTEVAKGDKLMQDGKAVGVMGSIHNTNGVALVHLEAFDNTKKTFIGAVECRVIL